MNRAQSEILKVARGLFAPGVLIGVVSTGDGEKERGFAFMVCDPASGVAIGIKGAGVQVFKLTAQQVADLRAKDELLSPLMLGAESRL